MRLCFPGVAIVVCLTGMTLGCGKPQVAPHNLQLTASLRTALSAENPQWLAANKTKIEQRHAAGEMSQEEYEAFVAIIDTAESGDWDDAEWDALALQKAQRPQ